MKHYKSKIGKYGVRWERVEGYRRKDGTYVAPHLKKTTYTWRNKKNSKYN